MSDQKDFLPSAADVAVAASPTNYNAAQAQVESHLSGIDTELGNLRVQTITGQIEEAADKSYILDLSAAAAYTIISLTIKTDSGTCTAKVTIDDVDVTGITSISVTSSETTASASGTNTVSSGETVALVISSNSSALDVTFTLKILGA